MLLRILFLVNRNALGTQAEDKFKETRLEDLLTFDQIYDMKGVDFPQPEQTTKLHISTVQGVMQRIMDNANDAAILTNPPFGTKKGGKRPTRNDLTLTTSNKQLNFLQVIYKSLKPGGRAAVVLPDNVLLERNVGKDIRQNLMEKCNPLETIVYFRAC